MKQLYMKNLLCVLLPLFGITTEAQNVLGVETSLMRDSDEISMQRVTPLPVGDEGMDVLWDFTMAVDMDEPHAVTFRKDTLGRHVVIEDDGVKRYRLSSDGLLRLVETEDRHTVMHYARPRSVMRYPLQYGDTLSSVFAGNGRYSGDHLLKVCGQTDICADAYGSLVMSEGDTLNALRVRSLTVTSMYMALDSIGDIGSAAHVKQEIEDSYDWYVRGYRYPLYRTVQRTSYSDMIPVATDIRSYRLLPENFTVSGDTRNDSILAKDSLDRQREETRDILRYEVSVSGGSVSITYTLSRDAQITALLTDISGIIYRKDIRHGVAGQPASISLDCSRLRSGTYTLYINVDGNVYSEKIRL